MDKPTSTAGPTPARVFVRDLVLDARIGVYEHERQGPQRIRVGIDMAVLLDGLGSDHLSDVVSYEDAVIAAREEVARGHVNLVETLAHRIAERCLADPRVRSVRVRIEKLDVFHDAGAAGVEIEHVRAD
ncbi:dihydroneopterin aldolase [Arenibaculum pallidiluteum]|uniref:dihydroneopterin aldolase n=1 Tax=Arenibaculum pallidiluteum TaxID=2812559 RepID=UPI001A964E87|nr:dihydroneopterin aldolase [Arenibaculum pallidiluteum]